MNQHKYPPPTEADPCPSPIPDPDRHADDFQADLVEGDEGGGTSGLGNKERKNGLWNRRSLNQ